MKSRSCLFWSLCWKKHFHGAGKTNKQKLRGTKLWLGGGLAYSRENSSILVYDYGGMNDVWLETECISSSSQHYKTWKEKEKRLWRLTVAHLTGAGMAAEWGGEPERHQKDPLVCLIKITDVKGVKVLSIYGRSSIFNIYIWVGTFWWNENILAGLLCDIRIYMIPSWLLTYLGHFMFALIRFGKYNSCSCLFLLASLFVDDNFWGRRGFGTGVRVF